MCSYADGGLGQDTLQRFFERDVLHGELAGHAREVGNARRIVGSGGRRLERGEGILTAQAHFVAPAVEHDLGDLVFAAGLSRS